MKDLGYQPHIDGLRAFAIGFVVLYHTGLGFLPGGFIGVDIFFVLSGFLITSYIYNQLQLGEFSFGQFYIRRVRRLIPAFLLVCVATLLIGLWLLLPVDLIYHAKLIGLSFLSIGNFYLANTTDGYFSRDVEEIPLLHMWSLSVEEQFYIIWPLLLLFAFKFCRKHILLVALTFFVVMVGISEWHVKEDPTRAFYLISTRAHELLIGAILAIVWERRYRAPQWVLSCLSIVSLAVLFASAIFVESSHEFLGVSSVWVCVATALLIYAGADNNVVTRFLRMPLLTGLGKISYSLYLWHWPLFAFYHYAIGKQTVLSSLILIVLSVILSTLSWYYVEQPVRKKREKNKITWLKLYITPVIVLSAMYMFVDKTDGVKFRFGERAEKISAIESLPPSYKNTCDNSVEEGECKRVIVMGDSHAMHFGPFIEQLVKQAPGYKLHSDAIPVCLPLYDIIQVFQREEDFFERQLHCRKLIEDSFNAIDESVKYYVLGGYWSNMDIHASRNFIIDEVSEEMSRSNTLRAREAAFHRTLDLLIEKRVTPVIIMDNPKLSELTLKCSHKKAMFGTVEENCDLERAYVVDQQRDIRQLFERLAERYPQLKFIDPTPLYCDDEICKTALDDGMPMYRDADHLNAVASARLGAMYLERFAQPFTQ